MDLTWWAVVVFACLGLAGCIVAALLWPSRTSERPPHALANTRRLTALPEYARAARLQAVAAALSIILLLAAFSAATLAAARPTGLPIPQRAAAAAQPEDIMVCVGAANDDAAVQTTMRYFAEAVRGFGSERIGLTSADRRVIPLTRDYQYAAARFADPGQLTSAVSYIDYARTVPDILALCLTGFPDFESAAPQRRSLIYIGPADMPDDPAPALFSDTAVRALARDGAVQVNAVSTGAGLPAELAEATGGRAYPATSDVGARLAEIRRNPPPPVPDADGAAAYASETPDPAVLAAIIAIAAVLLLPVVIRR
ncbi:MULTISPECIES: hypothetical protein [Mycobacteriaceae]|uniref:VWFA domain-containing protein n=1 Tax=Mycolicibacterium neoaurum VKM Ac-1815D TaxID=700508 RepID=V5X497_MYCNE|nr:MULTISPECIES: hypothetical protein [Mycobacteriaceae]AHC23285.1 hypothetical protein D174_01175 [Mycolicibacterium neoaurum VKM Ac-1815D]AMO04026.1 hypothetical protein MyAD_01145 [Mycolicibacterium neoaurum]AXK77713.1 hypothetical protein DXK33_24015 [Mycolicibacterium neoaurum]KJQ49821.1 hypothetical protein TS71_13340 [Mycolicibacterium neoaurum]KUM07599.1 hypothetical protein AVZ31_15155 [Mycolicibacterium neoaurum]